MNWFAISVVCLQVLASLSYAIDGKRADAALWVLYALVNLVVIFREKIG
jgi:hypothetical protein